MRPIAQLAAWLTAAGFIVLLSGCYESFPALPLEGGVPDGAILDGAIADGSVVTPPDGPPPDAGPPASPCTSGEIVPPYAGPGCSGTTIACLADCTGPTASPTCTSDCIDGDPECRMCVNQTLIACGNQGDCQDAWNAFACCAEERCPDLGAGADRLACPTTGECVAEVEAYLGCLDDGALTDCNPEVQGCFGAL